LKNGGTKKQLSLLLTITHINGNMLFRETKIIYWGRKTLKKC
jgi:hypothetical protein